MADDSGVTRSRASQSEFPNTPQARERLVAIACESFTQELQRSERLSFTDTAGPHVLLAEATLVVQVSDSQTGAALARVVDRRAAAPAVAQRASVPFNQSEIRRLMQRWARQLRTGLDTLYEEIIQ